MQGIASRQQLKNAIACSLGHELAAQVARLQAHQSTLCCSLLCHLGRRQAGAARPRSSKKRTTRWQVRAMVA